ncbi:uncharacterized protein BP01DRAFT_419089 [Aspergillus saccharolyticus JOP 1030-1]|uniref:SNARE complex subunit n=1 Tax=Aspergillus saccharolyticus JOP 1030-1 TaxID=1450539 RepID=A0A318ZBW4_9EURO|nr:hypothetical protein BP01DRAFT_419089 [Aspergillus saccharolyticus JOP 1030-1]PYH40970.1 hypothetical protein BP01DRAFT_419089 [Aspergillus saccharolyticus JOP 1030-1]
MPDKRKPSMSTSGASPYAKRSRASYADEDDEETPQTVTPYERPRNHPIYGQKSAFPGLDSAGDDELFYGPAEDGLEYLRMVRSEANSLPFLFNAPPTTTPTAVEATSSNDTTTQTKPAPNQPTNTTATTIITKITATTSSPPLREGVFQDGVYFVPTTITANKDSKTPSGIPGSPSQNPSPEILPAQSTYYTLLHHRFLLLRSILKCTPPSEAIAALDNDHPISLPRHSRNARREWRRLLLAVDPQTVQLACMDMESVLGVLGIMARVMSENVRSGDAAKVRRIAAWAWGLLARCREVGQMGTEEVGELRDLGKRAARVLGKMREEEDGKKGAGEGDEDDGEGEGEDDGEGEAVEQAEGGHDNTGVEADLDKRDADADATADVDTYPRQVDVDELEAAKARLQARIEGDGPAVELPSDDADKESGASEVALQIRAMLDMVITVVGEYYGQRDLLEARELWREATDISTTSPPFTIYNITLRLPLRSFTISKRYSDFTTFHTTLLNQTNAAPPAPLPPKSWLSSTVKNATFRESRRQALETYLRAINEAEDPRWRNSPAWRAFLNLPSLGPNSAGTANGDHSTATSARLHAAITEPGSITIAANQSNENTITDPTLWLDCFRDMKGHLHDARLHLTRRDQETTPQRQHESSARAKSSLVRAGSLIAALETGLKNISSAAAAGHGGGGSSASHQDDGGPRLGEGEIRRRRDLLINARKEKDGLEDLLNAMAAKSRIDSAVASIQDKEALMNVAATAGSKGKKAVRASGRVLGRETERTRELDNTGVLQLQKQMMQDQDVAVEELMRIVNRQKELGIAINNELVVQNELLKLTDEDATRLGDKIDIGKKRIGKIS